MRSKVRLGVNIDHVATVRQARQGAAPDPLEAALACERAGADAIVCHLREDRRHIQDADVARLRQGITTRLNLEMSVAEEIVAIAMRIRPDVVTLVPERRRELTTEGGLNVQAMQDRRLRRMIQAFHDRGIAVSLFIDPVVTQLEAAAESGAKIIELHTGRVADDRRAADHLKELHKIRAVAARAKSLGLHVAAGHGLGYGHVAEIAKIRPIEELNIGFSIISRALFVGLEQAVRDMVTAMRGSD